MKKTKLKEYIIFFFISSIIISILTIIDYFIHSLSPDYAVPSYYFRNKVIFGAIIGFIVLIFAQKLSISKKSAVFSAVVSLLLQVRYFLEGYPKKFVLEFLFIHFLILLPVSWIIFKLISIKEQLN
ncbi:MAG TPA: hypothetical protein VJJ53_01560 [Candidatus Nanoarchaeia archaeon]|nr:hypothetical protein [Candidatus Nanoarchaeia archaeon]